jgi:hypothetical protein
MDDFDSRFRELGGDVEELANPLFDLAQMLLRKHGDFLSVGMVLDSRGESKFIGASNDEEFASSVEILPILHDAIRATAAQEEIRAVAVCEWVKITPPGEVQTDAIKVLVEHVRGLTVALYLPSRKSLFGGWKFGEVQAMPAEPEVEPWRRRDPENAQE